MVPFGLSVELVGRKRKTFIGNVIQVPFAIGESILGLLAMGIRDWKTLQIVLSAPLFLLLLLYFILPESPRWLIATGRYQEARKVLDQAQKYNHVKLSPNLLQDCDESSHKKNNNPDKPKIKLGPLDLFKDPYVRKVTLIMFFNWIVVTLGKFEPGNRLNIRQKETKV